MYPTKMTIHNIMLASMNVQSLGHDIQGAKKRTKIKNF